MITSTPIEVAHALLRVERLLEFHTPKAVHFEHDDVEVLARELRRLLSLRASAFELRVYSPDLTEPARVLCFTQQAAEMLAANGAKGFWRDRVDIVPLFDLHPEPQPAVVPQGGADHADHP